ncbi:MAG: C69 family dipeptidase [Bacteroidetes bacterium]|nr:C69 family dipeptidase [Bacteroidota bacterium]
MKYLFLWFFLVVVYQGFSCTNFIVTKGASRTGSTFLAYTNDAEYLYNLYTVPAMDHKPGSRVDAGHGHIPMNGFIAQPEHTYATLGFHMNEFQVAIGETTFTGREELYNHSRFLRYGDMMALALQRAKTAREAVQVMIDLVNEYGYGTEGESISVIDPEEAWIMEIIGTGDGGDSAIYVAMRIPDGMVCAHANNARIGEFPLDDSENCLYSPNVISFAIRRGYYDPSSGRPFRFNEVYCPASAEKLRYSETRVWSMYRRVAPSLNLSPDYHRGVEGAQRYPLWIKPDQKLDIEDVFAVIRDHYEGTPFDMTKGLQAGPFGNPNHWRPLAWQVDSIECAWERPVSTYNTCWSMVAQCRSWLPDEVGGVLWFGFDDTFWTCYLPVYNSVTEIPEPYRNGNFQRFSMDNAWWLFNLVSNYANLKYSYMAADMKSIQQETEKMFIDELQDSDEKALALLKTGKGEALSYLTGITGTRAAYLMDRWTELAVFLITKYNDGYVKDDKGRPQETGYPEEWRRRLIGEEPEKYVLPGSGEEKVVY